MRTDAPAAVKKAVSKERRASQLELPEMEAIFLARKNGMTFNAIERDPRYRLKNVNGMTAWRAIQAFMKATGRRSCAGTALRR